MAVTEPEDFDDERSASPPADAVSPQPAVTKKQPSEEVVVHFSLPEVRSKQLDIAPAHRHLRDLYSTAIDPALLEFARRQQERYADIVRIAQGPLLPMLDQVNQVARIVANAENLARTVEKLRAPLVPLPTVETIEAIQSRYADLLSPLRHYAEMDGLVRMSSLTSTLTTAALGIPRLDPDLRRVLTANSASLQRTLQVVTPESVRPDRAIQFASEAALTVASGGLVLAGSSEGTDVLDTLVSDSRAELIARLDEVCPGVSEQLLGAWERLDKPGPAAVSQAADSIVELVDRTLRALAPKDEVLRWHTSESRSQDELHNGGPTRRLRVIYIFRSSGHPDRAARAADHLIGLCSLAQGEKHAGYGTAGLASLRLTLAGVEGALSLLLGL